MWVYTRAHAHSYTCIFMQFYAILCILIHITHIFTHLHIIIYTCTGAHWHRRVAIILLIYVHTLAHTHTYIYIYICTGRYVRRRLKGYQVHESAWNQCPVQTQAFKVFFTHALCNQYCMSGLKHSRGARFSNPRVRSWLQRSIRSVWEFSKESLQPIECYCPTPPHP